MEEDRAKLERAITAVAREEFSRSGGPGGQNVNKVNTQVTLRVPLGELAEEVGWSKADLEMVETRLRSRMNESGELVIQASDTRSQIRNREAAARRALELLVTATKRRRRRKATRPTLASRNRRLQAKRRRSEVKKERRPPEA